VISTAGVMGQPFSAAYCAPRRGGHADEALAVEYLESDVRVMGRTRGVDTPLVHDFGFPEGRASRPSSAS